MLRNFRSIQSLRAVAACMVVIFHFYPKNFTIGAAGVDIFFVISGFIMGSIATSEQPLIFVKKRLLRIAPLYWIFTALMCIGSIFGLYSNFTFSAETLIKSLLFIPYFNENGEIWPLMVVGWTLNIEIFFYAVFACGLAFRAPIALPAVCLAAIALLGATTKLESSSLLLWSSPIVLEFVAGLLLSKIKIPPKLGTFAFLLGISLLFTAHHFSLFSNDYRLLTWGLPATLIVGGAISLEGAGYWPKQSLWAIERLGDASYSLYLTHGFVVAGFHKFLGNSALENMLGTAVAISVAILVHQVLEKPINNLFKRSKGARDKLALTEHKRTLQRSE